MAFGIIELVTKFNLAVHGEVETLAVCFAFLDIFSSALNNICLNAIEQYHSSLF